MLRSNYHRLKRWAGRSGSRSQWQRRGVLGPLSILTRSEANLLARDYKEQGARSGEHQQIGNIQIQQAICRNLVQPAGGLPASPEMQLEFDPHSG